MEALWEKVQFWKKQKMLEENVDFRLHQYENLEVMPVELLKGNFQGVTYCYGSVNIQEDFENAKLKFDYIIIDSGKHSIEDLNSSEEFVTLLGDILVHMITTEGKYESARNDNTEEPDIL
jgi:hypothetical protein